MQVKLFGITGKKGCGKSSVAKIFRKNGIPVIDIDYLYSDMFKPGTNVHREIIKYFGEDYLTDDGNIDLKKLSIALCKENWIKEAIDSLMEEEIKDFIENIINAFDFHKIDIAGIESGILSHTIIKNYISLVVMVESKNELRLNRIKLPTQIIKNINDMENNVDWTDFDFSIDNSGSLIELEEKTTETIKNILLHFRRNINEE